MIDFDYQEYITFAKSINRVGRTILTFLILQSKHILHKRALYNHLSDKTSLNIGNFEYSNDNLAIDWLRHFDKHNAKEKLE